MLKMFVKICTYMHKILQAFHEFNNKVVDLVTFIFNTQVRLPGRNDQINTHRTIFSGVIQICITSKSVYY